MEIVTTLATIPAVLALVQLAKNLGVSGKVSMLLAVVLGTAIQVGEYAVYAANTYTAVGWYEALATGLILGLSASGLYDVARISGPDDPEGVEEVATYEWLPRMLATDLIVDPTHRADEDPVGALTDTD